MLENTMSMPPQPLKLSKATSMAPCQWPKPTRGNDYEVTRLIINKEVCKSPTTNKYAFGTASRHDAAMHHHMLSVTFPRQLAYTPMPQVVITSLPIAKMMSARIRSFVVNTTRFVTLNRWKVSIHHRRMECGQVVRALLQGLHLHRQTHLHRQNPRNRHHLLRVCPRTMYS